MGVHNPACPAPAENETFAQLDKYIRRNDSNSKTFQMAAAVVIVVEIFIDNIILSITFTLLLKAIDRFGLAAEEREEPVFVQKGLNAKMDNFVPILSWRWRAFSIENGLLEKGLF